jgi:hypothetical protein
LRFAVAVQVGERARRLQLPARPGGNAPTGAVGTLASSWSLRVLAPAGERVGLRGP